MKILRELLIIFTICLVGQLISGVLPIPFPASDFEPCHPAVAAGVKGLQTTLDSEPVRISVKKYGLFLYSGRRLHH